jgi:arylsulfatase A-like enzyme
MAHYAVHDPIEGRDDLVEKYDSKLSEVSGSVTPQYILEGNPDSDPLMIDERKSLLAENGYEGFSGLPRSTVKIRQRQDNTNFAAMVESVDISLGRIMAKLKELGLYKNTIVIFTSDNGGMSAANFGNPNRRIDSTELDKTFSTSNLPLRGAKGWLYEGGIRVPAIIKWSGVKSPGTVSDVPVINTDFYPTILEMLGMEQNIAQTPDGTSIVPLLHGEQRLVRDAIYWHFPHYSNHGMQSPGGAVRHKNYKLIEYYENGTVQLFNLENDLEEEHDLATQEPEKTLELRKMLQTWRQSVGARMMPPNPQYDSTAVPGNQK